MSTSRRRSKRQKGGAETYTAIMIEPRKKMQKALEFVIKNLLENLPESWNIMIFPGSENMDTVKAFVQSTNNSRLSVKDLGITSMNMAAYNKLMMSRKLLDEIPTEMFLVVQTDSLICRGGSELLSKFMKYDYVGAPWKDRNALGNGGFSLRRKSKMLEILEKCPTLNHNEDGFFSGGCEGAMPLKPTPEEAEEFSIETIFNGKQPFGIHKAWYHMPENSSKLEEKCLGYNRLRGLNSMGLQEGGSTPIKSAVMAIFKNESMVMKEWIEHYKWQGVDMIVMLNNDSNDDWKSITDQYPGFVKVFDAPGKHVQLKAYNSLAIPHLRENNVDVVVTIDLDEYLFGKDGRPLKEHLQEVFSKPDRPSAFTCGWSMFGSNGHKKQPPSIREGFTKRWQENAEPENGISGKTITFLKDIDQLSCIHIPNVKGRRDSCPAGLQLNHYPIMSEEYFQKVKMPRGDAFAQFNENARDMAYFKRYDNNKVDDMTLANQVKALSKKGGRRTGRRTKRHRRKRTRATRRRLSQRGAGIPLKDNITLGILCWKAFKTVENTLKSYKDNGFLDMVHPVIYFQERTAECDAIANKYGITDIMGTSENTGILQAFIDLIEHSTTPYFIFAECDFELVHNATETKEIMEECIKLMTEHDVPLVRLRDRKKPGAPLGSRDFMKGTHEELQSPDYKVDPNFAFKAETIHFFDKPEEKFPGVFQVVDYKHKWYICDSAHQTWSNNIFIATTAFLKEKVIPILKQRPVNANGKNGDKFAKLEHYLIANLKDYKIGGGDGLFTHNRLDR
jgi:hypothetical protein